jgi:hypothetical protein
MYHALARNNNENGPLAT